jgi:hypothetical protein
MCSLVQKTPYSSNSISIKPLFFLDRTLEEDLFNDFIDFSRPLCGYVMTFDSVYYSASSVMV